MIHNIINDGRWCTTCTSAIFSYTTSGTSCSTCGLPAPLMQPMGPPAQLIAPPAQPIQLAPMPQLNWSHFKPEFTGKQDKDAEAHLLRTND